MNVLLLYLVYPLAMGTYFRRALERRTDIDLKVVGPYTGTYIPWLGGMNLSVKYAKPPDIPLPYPNMENVVSYDVVKPILGNWKPDLVITVDAGICWASKPTDGVVAHVGTDPHVLTYDLPRSYSDKFFNMQKVYSHPGDIWLPYAYDPTVWWPSPVDEPKEFDAAMIGMPYPQRIEWVEALRRRGLKVAFENGPVFDEARDIYQRATIGLNWSSRLDLNARVFEVMGGMGLPLVTNSVPDLNEFFDGGIDYCRFGNVQEAVEQVDWLRWHPKERTVMAQLGHDKAKSHTYDARISQIFQECGF